jgi:hypothetical protein
MPCNTIVCQKSSEALFVCQKSSEALLVCQKDPEALLVRKVLKDHQKDFANNGAKTLACYCITGRLSKQAFVGE